MRRTCLMVALLVTACAETPQPVVRAPATPLPAPVPVGTPEQQAARRLQSGFNQNGQGGNAGGAQATGEPRLAPFDLGGAGQGQVMPDQVSPAFRGM